MNFRPFQIDILFDNWKSGCLNWMFLSKMEIFQIKIEILEKNRDLAGFSEKMNFDKFSKF